jgi:hypothetical protein
VARALLLNASFEPLCVVSSRRAVVLVLKEKAEIVHRNGAEFRSERRSVPVPTVIRLVHFVRVPFRASAPLSRRAVFARDGHRCQYCGRARAAPFQVRDEIVRRRRGDRPVRGLEPEPQIRGRRQREERRVTPPLRSGRARDLSQRDPPQPRSYQHCNKCAQPPH